MRQSNPYDSHIAYEQARSTLAVHIGNVQEGINLLLPSLPKKSLLNQKFNQSGPNFTNNLCNQAIV